MSHFIRKTLKNRTRIYADRADLKTDLNLAKSEMIFKQLRLDPLAEGKKNPFLLPACRWQVRPFQLNQRKSAFY
jgi:hypothetical protein